MSRFAIIVAALLGLGCDDQAAPESGPAEHHEQEPLDFYAETPPDLNDCAGSIGCECIDGTCALGLECMDGWCGPCPVGNPGCACAPEPNACDIGLACVDGLCEFSE